MFLAWIITNSILRLIRFPTHLIESILREFYIPEGFITLATYLPNLLLLGLYFTQNLKKSKAFKCWSGWKQDNTIVGTPDLHEREQVIYAVAPHGIHGEAVILNFALNPLYESVAIIATSILFYIPICREFYGLGGAVPGTSAQISKLLDSSKSILIVPEGMRGAIHPNNSLGVLKGIPGECEPRKGFIRCAVASRNHKSLVIVPVWMEGVDKMYTSFNIFPWLQKLILKNYYYPFPLLNFGWYGTFWPKPVKLTIKFGEPIKLVDELGAVREVDDIFNEFINKMSNLQWRVSVRNFTII